MNKRRLYNELKSIAIGFIAAFGILLSVLVVFLFAWCITFHQISYFDFVYVLTMSPIHDMWQGFFEGYFSVVILVSVVTFFAGYSSSKNRLKRFK